MGRCLTYQTCRTPRVCQSVCHSEVDVLRGAATTVMRVLCEPLGNCRRAFSFLVATSKAMSTSSLGQLTYTVLVSFEGTIQYGCRPTGKRAICFGGSTGTPNA